MKKLLKCRLCLFFTRVCSWQNRKASCGGNVESLRSLSAVVLNFFLLNTEHFEKYGVDFDRPFGKYLAKVHNITVFGALILAAGFGFDFLVFNGDQVYAATHPALSLIFHTVPANTAPMQLFYYAAMTLGFLITAVASLLFIILEGGNVSYLDFLSTPVKSEIIGKIWAVLGGLIGTFVFFVGGYLVFVVVVEATFFARIPGIEIVQAIFIARVTGMVCICLFQAITAIFPYFLHPQNLIRKAPNG